MDSGLAGSTVLITGASGGIGTAVARGFAEEGASLALHCHRNQAAAEELAAELDVPAAAIPADLRQEAAVDRLFAEALAEFGRLDAVVVNAGVWSPAAPLQDLSLEQWNLTLASDLTSAFLTCRAFFRHLREVPREAASVVLIGSTAALFGEAEHADYSAAKAGLAYGLTLSLKNEIVRLAPRGRVNCVCPGWVATRMADGALSDPEAFRRATATIPMKKVARPEDVARAVVFLSSDRLAGHVSGNIVAADGGMEGRLLNP